MKNMGIRRLALVKPWFRDHPQARYMAHGSEDVLENAEVYETLEEAVADSVLVVGTSRRRRASTPFMSPRAAAPLILENAASGLAEEQFRTNLQVEYLMQEDQRPVGPGRGSPRE